VRARIAKRVVLHSDANMEGGGVRVLAPVPITTLCESKLTACLDSSIADRFRRWAATPWVSALQAQADLLFNRRSALFQHFIEGFRGTIFFNRGPEFVKCSSKRFVIR
jgi:hypothetical protein